MRRVTSIFATIVLAIGFLWQWGRLFLDWAGRAFAMRDLEHGFDYFRQSIVDWLGQYAGHGNDIGPWVLMGLSALSLAALHVLPPLQRRWTTRAIEFEFPEDANKESTETLFKRSKTFLAKGQLPPDQLHTRITLHDFFIGVINPSKVKTLKNVRVIVDAISDPPAIEWPVDRSLIADRTKTDCVDIPPRRMEYFYLGQTLDDSNAGMFHPEPVSVEEYHRRLAEHERRRSDGLTVPFFNGGGQTILRNNGSKIHLSAYADDVLPSKVSLTINARERTVILKD